MVDVEMFTIQNTMIEPTLHQHFSTRKGRPSDWDRETNYYKLESIETDGDNVTYKVS